MAMQQGSGTGGCRIGPTGRDTIFLVGEVPKIDGIGLKQFGHGFSIYYFAAAMCHQCLVAKYDVLARCRACWSRNTSRAQRSFCVWPGIGANLGSGAW